MINLSHNSYVGNTIHNPYHAVINIGKYTSIAQRLCVMTAVHPMGMVSNYPFYEKKKWDYPKCKVKSPVNIGSDVWIGYNVSIVDAVTIGDGAIIGANSVIGKDIPPYAIAVGNPIKIIRYRFTEEQIKKLLKIRWWDWPEEKIKAFISDFNNIDLFIDSHFQYYE